MPGFAAAETKTLENTSQWNVKGNGILMQRENAANETIF